MNNLLAFWCVMCYNTSMPRKTSTTLAPYKGHTATVSRCTVRGVQKWSVRIVLSGGQVRRVRYPADQLRAANAYAQQADRAAQLDGTSWTEAEKTAIRHWRDYVNAERAAGRNVPPLMAVIQAAIRTIDERRAAATFSQAAAAYIEEGRARLKPARLALVQSVLARFTASLPSADISLAEMGEDTVKNALALVVEPGAAATTRAHYLNIVSAVFARAIERGLCQQNPAKLLLRTMGGTATKGTQPTFLQVEEVQALLHAAAQHKDKAEALHFVIGLLTGIRSAERCRLQWQDIRLDEPRPYINLPATKAKTKRARQVFIHGSHAEILRSFIPRRHLPGSLIMGGHANEKAQKERAIVVQSALAKAAGVTLPRNVLRHTAASYLCAYLESMSAAALNLGHSEQMLITHYRALVPHAEAVRYFSLPVPETLATYKPASKRKAASR